MKTMVIILLFATLLTAQGSFSGNSNGPIRLAYYDYGWLYSAGVGIDMDVVQELQRRSGVQFSTLVLPRARIWADIETGDLDMTVSGIQNEQRDRFAWFAHYLAIKNYAVIAKRTAKKFQSPGGFVSQSSLRFGAVRAFKHGATQDSLLEILRKNSRVEESPDAVTIFKKIKGLRLSGMYSQPPVFRKYLKDLAMEDSVVIVDWAPEDRGVPHGLVLSKKRFSSADANKWQNLIAAMKRDGTLKKIYLKYLPAEDVKRMLEF